MPIKAKSAKAKGRRLEQWLEAELKAIGANARRQPGSGAFEAFPHDVEAGFDGGFRLLFECKQRKKDAWATGERWLGQADILVVRIDPEPFEAHKEPRLYMKWSTFVSLVGRKDPEPCLANESAPTSPSQTPSKSKPKRKIASRPWAATR